jgi:hypothetical protein
MREQNGGDAARHYLKFTRTETKMTRLEWPCRFVVHQVFVGFRGCGPPGHRKTEKDEKFQNRHLERPVVPRNGTPSRHL